MADHGRLFEAHAATAMPIDLLSVLAMLVGLILFDVAALRFGVDSRRFSTRDVRRDI